MRGDLGSGEKKRPPGQAEVCGLAVWGERRNIPFPYIGISSVKNICASDGDGLSLPPGGPSHACPPARCPVHWLPGIRAKLESVNRG